MERGGVGAAGEQRAPCLGGGEEQLLAQKGERDLSHFISARPYALGLLLSPLKDRISFHLREMGSCFPGVHVALCESAAAGAQHPG